MCNIIHYSCKKCTLLHNLEVVLLVFCPELRESGCVQLDFFFFFFFNGVDGHFELKRFQLSVSVCEEFD